MTVEFTVFMIDVYDLWICLNSEDKKDYGGCICVFVIWVAQSSRPLGDWNKRNEVEECGKSLNPTRRRLQIPMHTETLKSLYGEVFAAPSFLPTLSSPISLRFDS